MKVGTFNIGNGNPKIDSFNSLTLLSINKLIDNLDIVCIQEIFRRQGVENVYIRLLEDLPVCIKGKYAGYKKLTDGFGLAIFTNSNTIEVLDYRHPKWRVDPSKPDSGRLQILKVRSIEGGKPINVINVHAPPIDINAFVPGGKLWNIIQGLDGEDVLIPGDFNKSVAGIFLLNFIDRFQLTYGSKIEKQIDYILERLSPNWKSLGNGIYPLWNYPPISDHRIVLGKWRYE